MLNLEHRLINNLPHRNANQVIINAALSLILEFCRSITKTSRKELKGKHFLYHLEDILYCNVQLLATMQSSTVSLFANTTGSIYW